MVPGYEYLSVLHMSRIIQALADVRTLPQELLFANRIPMTPAIEGEIVGRWINRVQIADLVADDSKALTYTAGKLQVENTIVPNIKHGRQLTQENINQLAQINAAPWMPQAAADMGDNEIVGQVLPAIVDDLLTGLHQRREALLVAMHLDQFSYTRFGMNVNGTWGIPADLKVNLQIPWTDANNATPVNDVWTVKRNASVRYGMNYNRGTMSTSAFIYMISTTEFQNKARTTLPLYINYANLPLAHLSLQRDIARNILGLDELDLYDARFWSQDASGNLTSAPYLPINKVILDSTDNDDNPAVQDFANGITTESMISGLLPNTGAGVIGSFQRGVRGPIAYTTVDPALNPPNLTIWGVMRGFPRRFRLQANAVMTVGQFTDNIPVSDPF